MKTVLNVFLAAVILLTSAGCFTTGQGAFGGAIFGAGVGASASALAGPWSPFWTFMGGLIGSILGGGWGKYNELKTRQEWEKLPPDVRGRILGEAEARVRADKTIEDYYRQQQLDKIYKERLKLYGVPTN